jgi:hypothetical protein
MLHLIWSRLLGAGWYKWILLPLGGTTVVVALPWRHYLSGQQQHKVFPPAQPALTSLYSGCCASCISWELTIGITKQMSRKGHTPIAASQQHFSLVPRDISAPGIATGGMHTGLSTTCQLACGSAHLNKAQLLWTHAICAEFALQCQQHSSWYKHASAGSSG